MHTAFIGGTLRRICLAYKSICVLQVMFNVDTRYRRLQCFHVEMTFSSITPCVDSVSSKTCCLQSETFECIVHGTHARFPQYVLPGTRQAEPDKRFPFGMWLA